MNKYEKLIALMFCGLFSISINVQETKMNSGYNVNSWLSELEQRIHFLNPLQQEEIVNYVSSSIFDTSTLAVLIDNQKVHIEATNQQLDDKNYIGLKFIFDNNEMKQLNAIISVYHYKKQNPLQDAYRNARTEFLTSLQNYSISPLPFSSFNIKTTGVRFIGSDIGIYWVYKNSFIYLNGSNTVPEKQIIEICNWIQAQLENNLVIQKA